MNTEYKVWYDTGYQKYSRKATDGKSSYKTPPDSFVGKPQTYEELLSTKRHGLEHITHMVIWGEIPPDLSTIAPELQRLELRETPQHSIDE